MEFKSVRGVVEGFYGAPYDLEGRRAMLEVVSGLPGTSAWLHAPKDDPWHRIMWRSRRSPDSRGILLGSIRSAEALGVSWISGTSPWGFEDGETPILRERALEAEGEGSSAFAVLFDDIPEPPSAALAGRQISFLSAAVDGLGIPVMTCPSVYCDEQELQAGGAGYLAEFERLLPAEWAMFWTGPAVIPRSMELGASVSGRAEKGSLVIWDNLLADDYSLRRIFLGDPSGRTVEGCGYLLNPSSRIIPALHSAWRLSAGLGGPSAPPAWLSGLEGGLSILAVFHDTPWGCGEGVRSLLDSLYEALENGSGFPAEAGMMLEQLEDFREMLVSSPGGFDILPFLNDVTRLLSIWRRALGSSSPAEELRRLLFDRLPWDHPFALGTAWRARA